MDTSNININYNILCEFIKSIVSHYMDDYDKMTAYMERAVGDGKDDDVNEEDKSSNDVNDEEESDERKSDESSEDEEESDERKSDESSKDEEESDESSDDEEESDESSDDEEESDEEDNSLEKKNYNKYKNYSFIDYIIDNKTDRFIIIRNIDNSDKIKINDFEKKLKHMKISNLEKIKLLLCALWSIGYKEKNLENIFIKNMYISSTIYNNDKQLELIINEFNKKFDNSIQDWIHLYLIHNCIL